MESPMSERDRILWQTLHKEIKNLKHILGNLINQCDELLDEQNIKNCEQASQAQLSSDEEVQNDLEQSEAVFKKPATPPAVLPPPSANAGGTDGQIRKSQRIKKQRIMPEPAPNHSQDKKRKLGRKGH